MFKECQSRPFRGNLMFKDQIHDADQTSLFDKLFINMAHLKFCQDINASILGKSVHIKVTAAVSIYMCLIMHVAFMKV